MRWTRLETPDAERCESARMPVNGVRDAVLMCLRPLPPQASVIDAQDEDGLSRRVNLAFLGELTRCS